MIDTIWRAAVARCSSPSMRAFPAACSGLTPRVHNRQVVSALALCTGAGVPVVPQGGNTGLVGGGVPLHGEVVLSLTRLNQQGPVDHEASQVTAGAGVTLQQVADAGPGLDLPILHQGRP